MSLPTSLADSLNHLVASRYLTGGFLAVLLWDHLTTLDREVNLIWKSGGKLRWMLRISFATARYGSEAFLIFVAYVTSGIREPSPSLCRSSLITLTLFGAIGPSLSQFIFLLRAFMVTDKRRPILNWLKAAFLIEITLQQIFAVLIALDITKTPLSIINSLCISPGLSRFYPGIMSPVSAFDILVITLSIYDGLSRPRKRDSEVLMGLYKGGAKYFLGIAAIYLTLLLTPILGPDVNYLIIVYPGWALVSIMVSRLHFEIEEILNEKYSLSFTR